MFLGEASVTPRLSSQQEGSLQDGGKVLTPKEYVLSHTGDLGLALNATTTKPIAYGDLKKGLLSVVGEKGIDNLKDAIEKLETSDILYEGLLGIPLPRVLFHEPKHGTIELEHSTMWELPALKKAQEFCASATRAARKQLLLAQKQYVRVGTDFVFATP